MDQKQAYLTLVATVNEHSRKYYTEDSPAISDFEFDQLYKELEQIEAEHPDWVVDYSPTKRVGGEVISSLASVTHEYPMLSLSNTYSTEEVYKFMDDVSDAAGMAAKVTAEPKIDGLAISLTYEGGKLVRAATRGDGQKGEDVTHNIKVIKSIPLQIDTDEKLIVRGEVYMPLASFNKINAERGAEGLPLFANPRNSAAGSLKLLDSSESKKRGLECFIFGIDAGHGEYYFSDIDRLDKLGFRVNKDIRLCKDTEEVLEHINEIGRKRADLDYEIDGVVIKANSYQLREEMGTTVKAPKWAIAYKYASLEVSTKLLNVEYQVGRTGAVTPVAVLEPVLISGSTVSKASLHNDEFVEMLGIHINDNVFVTKGGEVIPKVTRIDSKAEDRKEILSPEFCPECKSLLVRQKVGAKKDRYEKLKRCVNPECKGILRESIKHFVSKNAMDIAGLGESIIVKLLEYGHITKIEDIYTFDFDILKEMDGFGEKSVEKLKASIEESKNKPFEKVLFAIGIRNVGERTAEVLAEEFGGIDSLAEADFERLKNVNDVGDVTAELILESFKDKNFIMMLQSLKNAGLKFKAEKKNIGDILEGKSFLLTGKLEKPRKEYEDMIKLNGGKILSSVSPKLDYLIVGEKPGSKLDKAQKLGVNVISVEEFISMLNS